LAAVVEKAWHDPAVPTTPAAKRQRRTPTGGIRTVRLSRLLISALLALSVPLVAQADSSPEAAYQQELKEAFYAVRDRVGQQWDVPPGAKPMKEASLSIEVHPNGNFKAAMVTSSSGDRQFDRSAIKAIAKALPIPEWR